MHRCQLTSTLLVFVLSQIFIVYASVIVHHPRYVPDEQRDHNLFKRAPVAPPNPVGNWTYRGCYTDDMGKRTLSASRYDSNTLTGESCVIYCDGKGYNYAGSEYSGECYCDNSIASTATVMPASDCYMPCSGNSTEACGGPNRLTLYFSGVNVTTSTNTPISKGPFINPGPADWTYQGCYTDVVGKRTLPVAPAIAGGGSAVTIAVCAAACQKLGYTIAGTEYSTECYCGTEYLNGGAPVTNAGDCNMLCGGNATEYCGGPGRLSVYTLSSTTGSSTTGSTQGATTIGSTSTTTAAQSSAASAPAGWSNLGCYSDAVGGRTLNQAMWVNGALTVELCTAACKSSNFNYAGMEYAGECFCGNSIDNGGGPAPDGSVGCSMACNGNNKQMCGGPNRLNMYQVNNTVVSSTATSATTTTAEVPVSVSSTAPVVTGTADNSTLPAGWSYQGCYIDGANGRILNYQQPDSASNSVASCAATCKKLGYTIAGTEYSSQCFCDNYIRNGGELTANSDCNMVCSGNSSVFCGAGNRLSIYSGSATSAYIPPAVQKKNLPGNWTYQGCLYDDAIQRTFPYMLELKDNNTATNCLSRCAEFGYGAGGMEYGEQCFCGDHSDIAAAKAYFTPESDCNMPCTGNSSYLCGAGNRISYYNWTGAPISTWSYAAGDAAGKYEFLIGAPLIPLITTLGINNKITFLEKFGTSPAANSTGAYELDVTALHNFTQAWRPMHVKSDIFCAAGIVLPDRAGRQMNVGGWANDATYGIRMYAPDGADGVWGKNDWQENVDEVALMIGRWYPTAMIMSNGSVLIVGGQVGANGAPVPSLEILPRPPGVTQPMYCDYLERTDPYNLYPYLAVLPSGGVFVAYWNEARILDEKSLSTSRVLPNIPGAVNDFLGGRTYPMEGTAMLMPQHAPYTEPLTVTICGGSTIGPEIALDNCVSLQPDVPDAKWTIERMPSQRVISCMVALADGTYLILNGAKQGFAGFGLAIDPNHNAVLYDPTKPLGARMTVMANTTVDRLYHSEAILMPDGRVMVSGSDPEDERYQQEYRVEVFTPPYLMGHRTTSRPTFAISSNTTMYGYNSPIMLNVRTSTGSPSGIKVSLLGAVSSTHGNSMGQRTLFPVVSCTGNLCTVTTPPNAHVCPPGWFQLFVLDAAGTPSTSQWVRIGGDPANLGNWPKGYSDFTTPGMR